VTDTAIGIVGALCLINLALTLALARQLRGLSEMMKNRRAAALQDFAYKAGDRAPQFAATTTTGEVRTLDGAAGSRLLIAFFTALCPSCHVQAERLKEYAASPAGESTKILVVISGPPTMASEFGQEMEDTVWVAVEPPRGPTATAFGVGGSYPKFYLIGPDGRIEAGGRTVDSLPVSAPV
jgi:peroxiredoxin